MDKTFSYTERITWSLRASYMNQYNNWKTNKQVPSFLAALFLTRIGQITSSISISVLNFKKLNWQFWLFWLSSNVPVLSYSRGWYRDHVNLTNKKVFLTYNGSAILSIWASVFSSVSWWITSSRFPNFFLWMIVIQLLTLQ